MEEATIFLGLKKSVQHSICKPIVADSGWWWQLWRPIDNLGTFPQHRQPRGMRTFDGHNRLHHVQVRIKLSPIEVMGVISSVGLVSAHFDTARKPIMRIL
jgi:hypothetical protein